jgi:signal transduction histidine kinase/CheY-like chemotaxis protein
MKRLRIGRRRPRANHELDHRSHAHEALRAFVHDVVNPLAAIKFAATALRASDVLRKRELADVRRIERAAGLLVRMVEKLGSAPFDVTPQNGARAERARHLDAGRSVRRAIASQEHLIAVLGHELRAPLAPVLAAVSRLERPARARANVGRLHEIIRRNVLRQAQLIDDLLDLSRIASGKVGLQRDVVDLHVVARESLEMLADEASARRLSLVVELRARRPRVNGDPSRLRQVFTNLLKNAIKFTPEEGVIAIRSWNRGDTIAVEVSDNGVGIPPDALRRIFDRFEQADGAASNGGLGLGLTIARGMIGLHGGTIHAHSDGPGRGARFVVELRALTAKVETPAPTARALRARPGRAARGAEILLVEDEPDLAETLTTVLEGEGYRVRTVASAGEALAADLADVALVISDLGLPDLDGRVLIERLKSKGDVKAIALSGYGTEADVRASEAAGFERHLTKPVEMSVLIEAVERAFAKRPWSTRSLRDPPSG